MDDTSQLPPRPPDCTCRYPQPTPSLHEPGCPAYVRWVEAQRALQEADREARSSTRMLGLGCVALLALVGVAVTVALRILVFRG